MVKRDHLPRVDRMSQSTKRKYVTKEVLDELRLPTSNERIVRVVAGRGNNLHEVFDPKPLAEEGNETSELPSDTCGSKYLVSMPTKFRKNVWIKRGDFVVVEPIEEGDKVKAEIVQILYKDQIKYIKGEGQWPTAFGEGNTHTEDNIKGKSTGESQSEEEDIDDDSDLFQNTNRPKVQIPEEL